MRSRPHHTGRQTRFRCPCRPRVGCAGPDLRILLRIDPGLHPDLTQGVRRRPAPSNSPTHGGGVNPNAVQVYHFGLHGFFPSSPCHRPSSRSATVFRVGEDPSRPRCRMPVIRYRERPPSSRSRPEAVGRTRCIPPCAPAVVCRTIAAQTSSVRSVERQHDTGNGRVTTQAPLRHLIHQVSLRCLNHAPSLKSMGLEPSWFIGAALQGRIL